MALTVTAFQTANWTTTTTPLTISVTGALTGDKIVVIYGGDNNDALVSAATTSTTGGSTTAWTEPQEGFGAVQEPWLSSAWADVTADGTVTVSLARTQVTPHVWGGMALLFRGHNGLGNSVRQATSAAETVALTVSNGSAVAILAIDWDALAVVAFSPGGATDVHRAQDGGPDLSNYAGYWLNQSAGTTSYGIGTSATTKLAIIAIEVLASTAESAAPRFLPGKTWKRRFKHRQRLALDPTVPPGPNADPTQAGYGPEWRRWRRDAIPPVQPNRRLSIPGLLELDLYCDVYGNTYGGACLPSPENVQATRAAALYADRRSVPQQRQYKAPPGLLDGAQLEVPPPLAVPVAAVYQRLPWLRVEQTQADQSSAAVTATDPTQSGVGPEWRRWRRDSALPQQRELESSSDLLATAELENELLGGATTELRTYLPVTHADRREYPQQRELESSYGLFDQALLEVPPPLSITYDLAATHQRLPWVRLKPVPEPYSLLDQAQLDVPPPLPWFYDLAAYQRLPWLRIKQVQVDQSVTLAPDFDPIQAGYGPEWRRWRRDPIPPQQRLLISAYGQLDTALLEVPPPLPWFYDLAATHQRLPWIRIKQVQYDQSTAAIITDLDPTQNGGYGPEWRRWYRSPVLPQQRELESAYGLLDQAQLEVPPPLPWFYDLAAYQRLSWVRTRSATVLLAEDLDPTLAGYGPRWMWYRAPVAPQQRDRRSDPLLLLTALLEDALLGGWDDLLRHRTWYVDRREVPQQRSYPAALQPPADPLLVSGAEWRYRLIPATHRLRWVLRQWWQQQTFQGSGLQIFEGTITGGRFSAYEITGGRPGSELDGVYGTGSGYGGTVYPGDWPPGITGGQLSAEPGETYSEGGYGDEIYPGDWPEDITGGSQAGAMYGIQRGTRSSGGPYGAGAYGAALYSIEITPGIIGGSR